MQLLLPWMTPDLDAWKKRPIHPKAAWEDVPEPYCDAFELTLATEPAGPPQESGPFQQVASSVLGYHVFGPKLATPVGCDGEVRQGQTIGLRYRFCPGLDLFFASRVTHVFKEVETEVGWQSGFFYRTLTGHPALGEERFVVTKDRGGAVIFSMKARSRPALWYVRLLTPLARSIQHRAARQAGCYLSVVARSHS